MNEKPTSRGTITIGAGTDSPQQIEIADFLQAEYLNHRLISVVGLEDDTLLVSVENPASSGRAPATNMRLSQESFLGLLSTMHLYLSAKGFDLEAHLKEAAGKEQIDYSYSDNLSPAFASEIICDYPTSPEQPSADVTRGGVVLGRVACITASGGLIRWYGTNETKDRPCSASWDSRDTPQEAVQDVVDAADGKGVEYVKHCQQTSPRPVACADVDCPCPAFIRQSAPCHPTLPITEVCQMGKEVAGE